MTLGSPGEWREIGQEERLKAMRTFKTWAEDPESTTRSISENERSASSDYLAWLRTYHLQAWRGMRQSQRPALREDGGGGDQGRQYCTQKCLLGIVEGRFLDPDCPNVALHYKSRDLAESPAGARHPVTCEDWLRLLRNQLEQSIDEGISRLRKSGTRGVLLQVTLLAHGYTFVAKGTVEVFAQDLEDEAAVYERLRPIQGVNVPVFLGPIDLESMDKPYHYDHRMYV
ncbi:reticulocyte-binding protein 2 like protein a [Fusarium bulbicola]|nr:reticulocyte-binding protein 2 like protein a [Fusarium bulbicola]